VTKDEAIQAFGGNSLEIIETEEKSFNGLSPPSKSKINSTRPPLLKPNTSSNNN